MVKTSPFLSLPKVGWVVLITLSLAACGGEDPEDTSLACVATEGEVHLAHGQSQPSKLATMLHQVGRTCPSTGWNTFRLHAKVGEAAHAANTFALSSMHEPMEEGLKFAVTAVNARMPAMGHGTAEPARLKGAGDFEVNVQMPGSWTVEVTFEVESANAPTEPASIETTLFDVEVR